MALHATRGRGNLETTRGDSCACQWPELKGWVAQAQNGILNGLRRILVFSRVEHASGNTPWEIPTHASGTTPELLVL